MKGLWIKDINLLKGQKQFWIGIIVIAVILLGWTENPTFVICYMAVVASMFSLNTMSYDEMQNGLSYLFTLPVSRKGYLKEKYLFGMVLAAIAMLVSSLAAVLAGYIKHRGLGAEALSGAIAAGLLISAVLLAVTLPLQVKFGMEKSRIALLAVYGICFLLGAAGKELLPASLFERLADTGRFLDEHFGLTILGFLGIGVLFMVISYLTAVRFMKKKQF